MVEGPRKCGRHLSGAGAFFYYSVAPVRDYLAHWLVKRKLKRRVGPNYGWLPPPSAVLPIPAAHSTTPNHLSVPRSLFSLSLSLSLFSFFDFVRVVVAVVVGTEFLCKKKSAEIWFGVFFPQLEFGVHLRASLVSMPNPTKFAAMMSSLTWYSNSIEFLFGCGSSFDNKIDRIVLDRFYVQFIIRTGWHRTNASVALPSQLK